MIERTHLQILHGAPRGLNPALSLVIARVRYGVEIKNFVLSCLVYTIIKFQFSSIIALCLDDLYECPTRPYLVNPDP